MKRKRLYTKFHQVMDYAFPLLILFVFFRASLPVIAQVVLATMVLVSLVVTVRTYRVSIDRHNLYLNNLFITKVVEISSIKLIEPAPFYYGATSGRVSEKGYRIVYEKDNKTRKIVVLVSKNREVQQVWDDLSSRRVKMAV